MELKFRLISYVPNSCSVKGFSLIELMVALMVTMVLLATVYTVYTAQHRDYTNQQTILRAQQNLRGSFSFLEQEIRMIGYDPRSSKQFGITDIRRYSTFSTSADSNGQPALFYTADWNENGQQESNEEYAVRIRHDQKLDRKFLTISIGDGGRQRIAENIEAIGFAYAIDFDRNGNPDTWAEGTHCIWAVDSDNDNLLDAHLDTNNDGDINEHDDTNGDQMINGADGANLKELIPVNYIKAIRIWLLSTTGRPLQGYCDFQVHVVGDQIVTKRRDSFQRKVSETIVECRNL